MPSMCDWVKDHPEYECATFPKPGFPHMPMELPANPRDAQGRRKLACYWCNESLTEADCFPGYVPDKHLCHCHDHCGE